MSGQFDYWGLLAGIALFLFAMSQLETGLKTLGGRSLAVYLKQQTDRRINAVIGGIVSTAMLQSSSVVGLMVLAFTGAGLLNLTSALGIVFGSNLGTTLTGWIVATLGFKFEIFELSLPLIGIGGLIFVFGRSRWAESGRTLLGLGLLLLGLQMMKSSVASIEQVIDINELAGLAPWQYLLFGTAVAAVIQSSSATMMITLAALHAGIIELPNAAAVAIGADLGTTTTVLLGAINGSRTKQQVAAGHVIFNVVSDALAFLLRLPLLGLIAWIGIHDPLYSLVAFHSLFNFLGLLIFIPLTGAFARQLERLLPGSEIREASYLSEVSSGVSEATVNAVEQETSLLIARVLRLTMIAFEPPLPRPSGAPPIPHERGIEAQHARPFAELYSATKTLEGELLEFTIRMQTGELEATESERLSQLLNAAREAMHSAKAIKDIRHNLVEIAYAGGLSTQAYEKKFRDTMREFLNDLYELREQQAQDVSFEGLITCVRKVRQRHDALHDQLYIDVRDRKIDQLQVSTLLNVNREIFTCHRALLLALGHYHLSTARMEDLEVSL